MKNLFFALSVSFLFISSPGFTQDTNSILTPDPNAVIEPIDNKVDWSKCEAEINKHCAEIVAEEAAEKAKSSEPDKKDDGFKNLEASDETKTESPVPTVFTDQLKKNLPPKRDIAKHDCLSKVVINDFSRECLSQFRGHCSKFNKNCGRRKRTKKK
jgi:hypothetical protein